MAIIQETTEAAAGDEVSRNPIEVASNPGAAAFVESSFSAEPRCGKGFSAKLNDIGNPCTAKLRVDSG